MRTILCTFVLVCALPLPAAVAQDDGNAGIDTYLERIPSASGDKVPGESDLQGVHGDRGSAGAGGSASSAAPPPSQGSTAGTPSKRHGPRTSGRERSHSQRPVQARRATDIKPSAATADTSRSGLGGSIWIALMVLVGSVLAAVGVRRHRTGGTGDD